MSNLREALRDIVFKCAGGIGDMGDTEVNSILATLQTAVLAVAPEKLIPEPHVEQNPEDYIAYRGMIGGHNEAIDQYTKALKQLFESEEL